MSLGRIAIFLSILTALVAALSVYVGFRLIPAGWPSSAKTAAWLVLGAVVLVQPLAFLLTFAAKSENDVLSWAGYIAMGLFTLLLTFTLLRDLGWFGVRLAGGLPDDPSRRAWLLDVTSAAVTAVAASMFGVGFFRAIRKPTIVDVTVPITNLPDALNGFVIAQISDIHVGPTIHKQFIDEVVAAVNSCEPDLVAFTGDLVDGSVEQLSTQTAPLSQLKSKHGSFFITGNHEYYSGALEWLDEARRIGFKTLVNEHVVLEHGGERVVLAGVTDLTAGSMIKEHATDPTKAIAGAPEAPLKILLAHQPRSAFDAVKLGFQLQLSGHTHGGQYFPGTALIGLVQPFAQGLHKLEDMWIYTNRGTGYWGPPIRHTSVTSEVTKITLVRA
jgi:predicted MPP superfamily phosphohydrolase